MHCGYNNNRYWSKQHVEIHIFVSLRLADGETVPLSDTDIDAFEFSYRELGSMGERVLAFCDMDLQGFAPDHKFDLDEGNDFEVMNLRFIGMVAMIDPPR